MLGLCKKTVEESIVNQPVVRQLRVHIDVDDITLSQTDPWSYLDTDAERLR